MSRTLFRAAMIVSLTLGVAAPAVAATEDTSGGEGDKCMIGVWLMYNNCLMTTDSIFAKILCDAAFELNAMTCARS